MGKKRFDFWEKEDVGMSCFVGCLSGLNPKSFSVALGKKGEKKEKRQESLIQDDNQKRKERL